MSNEPSTPSAEGADTAGALAWPFGTEDALAAAPAPDGDAPRVLVLGATGYIGGRLVPRMLAGGYRVRVLTRTAARIAAMPWADDVEVVEGDAADEEAMRRAVADVHSVVYLVHSMSSGKDYGRLDRAIALAVARACADASVRRIIYLSGLHPPGELSAHLASRKEVGDILLASATPTIVLQAGVVIGSGSASFEMVRHLTEVLPYMPAPRWVLNRIQPISVRDVLYYLLAALRVRDEVNDAFDIGGPDVLRYTEMMNGYAEVAELPHRAITALPVFTPRLASHWVGLVTPVPRRIAVPLVESLLHTCVVRDGGAIDTLIPPPPHGLTGYHRAVRMALGRIELDDVETSWADARVPGAPSDPMPSDPEWAGRTVFQDSRSKRTSATASAVWDVVTQVGGATGWYSASVLWATRGLMDRVVGGVGHRRGRRTREGVRVGDAIDVWRVEAVEDESLLRLRAEMRVPGKAWLELGVEPRDDGSVYRQRAVFFPRGLTGRLYWLAMLPFHGLVFSGMVNRIVAEAEGDDLARRRGN
ncbi:SDR family oxidoreductase [Demequina sp. NBRC 110055]|uniref:SDR family oxidoreductase n=1 Tax=Demequina sp. NBRC 110055 TaxID=1570344 RepID=UPI0009FC1585|nr:SDR family oxidoreductase [Demequina sp. NBRC 110055]